MHAIKSLTAAVALLAATAAQADTPHPASDMIGTKGLAATEAHFAALANPTSDDLFALGGVQFLRAIEGVMQKRWSMGMQDFPYVPILRLPVPPNPNPEPFHAGAITDSLKTAVASLTKADATLASIDGEVGTRLDLSQLWFDVDMDGERDAGEGVMAISGDLLNGPAADRILVRFDTADVAWLRAYANLLSGVSETIIAVDPTDAIALVTEAAAEMDMMQTYWKDPELQTAIDQGAIFLLALRNQPDVTHSRAALKHFETMTAQNLIFWDAVAKETDNDAEWIPNPQQTSAFGIRISADVAKAWQAILKDGQDVLNGDLLIPYWRDPEGRGINMRKMFEAPTPLDPVMWVQGAGALPYLEEGPLVGTTNIMRFLGMLGGDAPLYALWLN